MPVRPGISPWGGAGDVQPVGLLFDTHLALDVEAKAARRKFPGNRFLLAAATEELGELAQAILQKKGREAIQREALQVAVVALRILEEGDNSFADITDAEAKP